MDNINVVVLIVAIVFVAAGVALIALSAVVGRGTPATAPLAEAATKTDPEEEAILFIDEPLTTDLAEELAEPERGRRPPAEEPEVPEAAAGALEAPADEAGAESTPTPSPAPTTSEVEPAAAADEAEPQPEAEPHLETEPEAEPQPEAEPEGAGEVAAGLATTAVPVAVAVAAAAKTTPAPSGSTSARAGAYEFSVQLGFKYLDNKLYAEAATEFQKAATLTDDREAKLSLYTQIGDALRLQGMSGPACASYLQATAYTDDPDERARLERFITEMTDTEPGARAGEGLRGDEEE